jgi:integrase
MQCQSLFLKSKYQYRRLTGPLQSRSLRIPASGWAQRWSDNLTHLKPSTLERYRGILTLAFTGLRFGELAALKVRRFDEQRKRLNVVESVTEVGSELVWTTPKTHQKKMCHSAELYPNIDDTTVRP